LQEIPYKSSKNKPRPSTGSNTWDENLQKNLRFADEIESCNNLMQGMEFSSMQNKQSEFFLPYGKR